MSRTYSVRVFERRYLGYLNGATALINSRRIKHYFLQALGVL